MNTLILLLLYTIISGIPHKSSGIAYNGSAVRLGNLPDRIVVVQLQDSEQQIIRWYDLLAIGQYKLLQMQHLSLLVMLQTVLVLVASYNTMPPVWVPTPDIRTFSMVYVNRIGSTSVYDATEATMVVPFPSGVTFTSAPKMTMALNRYEADSDLTNTFIIFFSTPGLVTATSFQLDHFIKTPIWTITYRCMTRASDFPYHLNVFNNVLAENAKSFTATTSYTILKSYSSMATSEGYSYTTFTPVSGSDFSNMKIITFLSCFGFNGTGGTPPIVFIDTTVLNTTHFYFNFIFGTKVNLDRCHLNMVVYNQAQLEASGLFRMQYAHVNFTNMGGEFPVAQQFESSTMMGWTDYSATTTARRISFNMTFSMLSTPVGNISYGVTMQPPVIIGSTTALPVEQLGVSLFYMQYMICTNTTYYYLDIPNKICIECNIIDHCLRCLNSSYCLECVPGYLLNSSHLCDVIQCGIPYCVTCLNATACSLCDYNSSYAVNAAGTCSLCDSTLNMFINMSSPNKECLNCSQVACGVVCPAGQYLDVPTQTCMSCPLTITNCSQCYYSLQCTVCQPGYAVNALLLCQQIQCPGVSNCSVCLNTTACYQCDYNSSFYVDQYGTCSLCDNSLNLFINASSSAKECVNCSQVACGALCQVGQYLDVPTQTCINCSSVIANCTICYFAAHCLTCQPGSYVDASLLCSVISCPSVPHCNVCLNTTACHTCSYDSSYYLDSSLGCSLCDNSLNMFINMNSAIKDCVNCSQFECGPSCPTGQYLDVPTMSCRSCSAIPFCLQCYFDKHCTLCQPGYSINSSLLCEKIVCNISQCLLCLNTSACLACDYSASYYLHYPTLDCLLCDNSKNMFINISSTGVNRECINCTVVDCGFINGGLGTGQVERSGCNEFMVKLYGINQTLGDLLSYCQIANAGVTITEIRKNSTGNFTLWASYTQDLLSQLILIKYKDKTLNLTYSPALPALYYSSSECKSFIGAVLAQKAYAGVTYIALLGSLGSAKIVGLEMFGTLQLAYFSLALEQSLNVYLAPLVNFRLFNGFNPQLYNETTQLPPIMQSMGVFANFINNCNVMLILFYVYALVVGGLCFVFKFLQRDNLFNMSLRALKEGMITLIVFNCFNLGFSAGVHWKYSSMQDSHYALASFFNIATFLAVVAAIIAMHITERIGFGEFKNKFKEQQSQLFIPLTILLRTLVGLFCGARHDDPVTPIIIFAFWMAFIIFILLNKPFQDPVHNYRSILIQGVSLYVILVACYYGTINNKTPVSVKSRIYAPAIIELVLLGVCIVVSVAAVIRDVYRWVKELIQSRGKVANQGEQDQLDKYTEQKSTKSLTSKGSQRFFPKNSEKNAKKPEESVDEARVDQIRNNIFNGVTMTEETIDAIET